MPPETCLSPQLVTILKELSTKYPNTDVALAKIARLRAALTLPKGTIHVVSDVHGEFKKLKHVINNASGSLRVLVDQVFGDTLSSERADLLLKLIYYPRETFMYLLERYSAHEERRAIIVETIGQELELLRALGKRYTLESMEGVFPPEYRELFRELLIERHFERASNYRTTIIEEFIKHDRELDLLRLLARMIRNLLISELIVAGDLGDRGERIDKVIEYLMRQPNVRIVWGNHDTTWIGACLGDPLCIATVLRISLRYGRLAQLEEGYGIPLAPLERLVENSYAGMTAPRFKAKGESSRDPDLLALMQKAIAMIQFKLEGQTIARHPEWNLGERRLLHKIDRKAGTVTCYEKSYPLLDTELPTLQSDTPYELTPAELACMDEFKHAFLQSPMLWRHISFVVEHGALYEVRDDNLIFHACVPCNEKGAFLPLIVDGTAYTGKELFDELTRSIRRAFRKREQRDLDLLWYLWCGPNSPLFGKDKMTTFEGYFIEDKATHKEHNNPHFSLIHEVDYCDALLQEFGVSVENGLIINGHVPVKIDSGESPLKRSGKAVTIDGAFSEAYGDKGYTLVLESRRTFLAQHHHFTSIRDAIVKGNDIIPTIHDLKQYAHPRTIEHTEEGKEMLRQIELLELLITAYDEQLLIEQRP
jgi:fructose-1,6-bisphosphatase-3